MDSPDPNAVPDPAAYSSPPPSPSRSNTIIEEDQPKEVRVTTDLSKGNHTEIYAAIHLIGSKMLLQSHLGVHPLLVDTVAAAS